MTAPPRAHGFSRRSVIIARALGALALAGFVGLLAYGLAAQLPNPTIDDALADGRPANAPELRLPPLTGQGSAVWDRAAADGTVDLRELRGSPLVINFWASWCAPCATEAPVLKRGWNRAREQGVLVLGVNQQDRRSEARRFVARHGLNFPHVRDQGRDTADAWGVSGLPETFFLSARGDVVGHVVGAISPARLAAGVAGAISGQARPPQAGGARGGVQ